jgi:hypothetical protein
VLRAGAAHIFVAASGCSDVFFSHGGYVFTQSNDQSQNNGSDVFARET